MIEEWRPIIGYEKSYAVSNLGRVKSIERDITWTQNCYGQIKTITRHYPERIIKQGRRQDGYADVPLSINGVTTLYVVHRLIAQAFIPNPNNYRCVNHIDGDTTNNSIDNLEWTNDSQNNTHAVQHFMRSQCIPVYCEETDKVYASMQQADRELGLVEGSTYTYVRQHPNSSRLKYHLRLATDAEIAASKSYVALHNEELSYKTSIPKVINPTKRQVKCLDTGQLFESVSELSRKLNVTTSAIESAIKAPHCCKGYTLCYVGQLNESDEHDYMLNLRQRAQSKRGVSYWRYKNIEGTMPMI